MKRLFVIFTLAIALEQASAGYTYLPGAMKLVLHTGSDCTNANRYAAIDIKSTGTTEKSLKPLKFGNHDKLPKTSDISLSIYEARFGFTFNKGEETFLESDDIGKYNLAGGKITWGKDDTEGSEHKIDGKGAAGELIFLFKKSDDANKQLLLSYFLEATSSDNTNLDGIIGGLTTAGVPAATNEKTKGINSKKLSDFLEMGLFSSPSLTSFYQYEGTSTATDCLPTDAQHILVTDKKIKISSTQLAKLRGIKVDVTLLFGGQVPMSDPFRSALTQGDTRQVFRMSTSLATQINGWIDWLLDLALCIFDFVTFGHFSDVIDYKKKFLDDLLGDLNPFKLLNPFNFLDPILGGIPFVG